jgi:nucleoside-diphosphate-sugar epimerase
MENKKIAVVTGGSGFVGSHLVDLLIRENYEVRCKVKQTTNLRWLKEKELAIYT